MARKIPVSKANLFLIVIAVILIYLLSTSISREALQDTLQSWGALGPLIFGLLMLITYVFAPLSGTPFILAGFYLYGPKVVFFTSIAAWISSIINFWIARQWGRPLVGKLVGVRNIKKIDKLTKNYGLLFLFFLRVFIGSFHDFVSYAAGLTPMKFSRYFLATTLGMIPGTLLWYGLSLRANNPLEFVLLSLALIFIFAAIFFLSQKITKKVRK